MTKKASMGAGNVPITLDGEECVLRPTLKAAQTISRQAGGLMAAIEAITKFDFDAITQIIALGLDRPVKDVADEVWRTGLSELSAPAVTFVSILANGGRPLDSAGGEEGTDPQSE
ncbi:hypothetical protein [Mesorhizobium sp. Z1-4]|uniref:hypothetical protein n=1 Tax=Mesorhizobium sp. Z1-4 TaxID=2448478 RepID=UPI000FDC3DE9|nr:hypothetical protein [Mesorhizobium sp. Z1-4]